MKNCSVKKFKGSVNNNELERFASICITIPQSENANTIDYAIYAGGKEFKIEALDNGYFHNTDLEHPAITELISSSKVWIVIPNQPEFRLLIKSKYEITEIVSVTNTTTVLNRYGSVRNDISKFRYMNNLTNLQLFPLGGDASFLKEFQNIEKITIREDSKSDSNLHITLDEVEFASKNILKTLNLSWGSGITGNIVNLSNCIALTTLNLEATLVTGDLDSFATAMAVNRKSGSLTVNARYSNIKYQGEAFIEKLITFGTQYENGYQISDLQ